MNNAILKIKMHTCLPIFCFFLYQLCEQRSKKLKSRLSRTRLVLDQFARFGQFSISVINYKFIFQFGYFHITLLIDKILFIYIA